MIDNSDNTVSGNDAVNFIVQAAVTGKSVVLTITTVQKVYKIIELIYKTSQAVKINQEQCKRLTERVKVIESAIKSLPDLERLQSCEDGLNNLLEVLSNCLKFIKQFSGERSWFKASLNMLLNQGKLHKLTNDLQNAVQQLNLGLAAQQIVNYEQDRQDWRKDIEFIKIHYHKILALNEQELRKTPILQLSQSEQDDMLALQLTALNSKMQGLLLQEPTKQTKPESSIFYCDLTFNAKIAEGSFGKIYQGNWGKHLVAIKRLEDETTNKLSIEAEQQLLREAKIMGRLRHPNIVTFYGFCLENNRACIIMEYMEQGSLSKLLTIKLSLEQKKSLALDIANGLDYLHKRGVLHRDLKSNNVLVNSNGTAKLTDFGLAKTRSNFSLVQTTKLRSNLLQFQAPECFALIDNYTAASDVYSYGLILWELFANKQFVVHNHSAISGHINLLEAAIISTDLPNIVAELITSCWAVTPDNRPSLTSIIEKLEAYQPAPSSPTAKEYYQLGQATELQQNFTAAFNYYKKSMDKGYYRAKTNLGYLSLKGLGVNPSNPEQAYSYFVEAATAGHHRAMYNLGVMFESGDYVEQDLNQALSWYQQAEQAGNQPAQAKCHDLTKLLFKAS